MRVGAGAKRTLVEPVAETGDERLRKLGGVAEMSPAPGPLGGPVLFIAIARPVFQDSLLYSNASPAIVQPHSTASKET